MHAPHKLPLGSKLDLRLAAYAAFAGVAVTAPSVAQADTIYSGLVNINIPSTVDGLYLNVVTGMTGSTGAAVSGWDINPWNTSSLNFFTPTPRPGGGEMVGSGSNYFNVSSSGFIGPGSTFANVGTTTSSASMPLNFNSSLNFVGFRFINEAAGGQIQYGWLQLGLSGTEAAQPRTIIGYAYENTGAAVGLPLDIPEPAAATLLALAGMGAVGLRTWRRGRVRLFFRE